MLKVGITGGIGSGKSTVCALFEILGIPVLYADAAARLLMETDAHLIAAIKKIGGDTLYASGSLNRQALAASVFADPQKLARLNALVHPATIKYGMEWMEQQHTNYIIKEAALFFESGSYSTVDIMVGISAPKELRIARAMKRLAAARDEVLARISQQMDEDEKMSRCDFLIVNDDVQALVPQVLSLHTTLLDRAANTRT